MTSERQGRNAFVARLSDLLESVRDGSLPVPEALGRLRSLPFSDLGFARVDHHREAYGPLPEVVYAPGKTLQQLASILDRLLEVNAGPILVTRCDASQAAVVESAAVAAGLPLRSAPTAGAFAIWRNVPATNGRVVVVTGGTADLPVAEESVLTASLCGTSVELIADIGVAGLHRLLDARERLEEAHVVVVVAGMEGALASVVGGLVGRPVIACPTSVGYGATFGGLAALLSMLSSCSLGVSCVNIDDGVGAGYVAALVATAGR